MKTIPLNGQYAGHNALVDDNNYSWLSQYSWSGQKCRHCAKVYARSRVNGKVVLMHQLILKSKNKMIDHRDGDGLNNQESNLRVCTMSQNISNTKVFRNNKSGYKGVSYHKAAKKFTAQIQVQGKRTCLGFFENPHHAAMAYDLWAIELYGEFANTNFPVVAHSQSPPRPTTGR